MSKEQRVEAPALVQLLNAALLHPESAEGYIRQVIETLSQPLTADAEMAAKGIAEELDRLALLYITHADKPLDTDEIEPVTQAILPFIATAFSAAKQQGADEQREKDARKCEDLVTYTEDHGDQEPCKYCLALETAAMIIRSNQ